MSKSSDNAVKKTIFSSHLGGGREGAFFSSLGLLVILNVVIKPIWIFVIDRKVQLQTGQAEYGSYFALLNLSIVFSFLLDLGFTNYFNRQLAFHQQNFIHYAGNFLLLKIFLVFIYAVLVFFIAWITGIRQWHLLLSLLIIQALTSLFLFFRAIITALQWFRTDAWLSVLDKTLLILLCGSLLFFPAIFQPVTINNFLFLQITCTGLAAISALGILLRRGVGFSITVQPFFRSSIVREAWPFALVVFLMALHYRADGFLLERLKGPEESGLYATAYRLLDAANMVGWLFASFLLPYLSRQWSGSKDISPTVLTARHVLVLYSIFIATAMIFLAFWLGPLIYEHKIKNVAAILGWLMPALLGYSLVQVYGTVLTATGLIKPFCLICLIAVSLNLLLNFLLIPSQGAVGACRAAIISQLFFGIVTMIYCRQKLGIPLHFQSLATYLLFAAALSALFLIGRYFLINNWILLAAGGIVTLLFLLLLKPAILKYWLRLKTSVT